MAKMHTGGCHCGAFKFEVQTDLEKVMDCNCSHCQKRGFLLTFVPADSFKLLSGDESQLLDYRFNKKHIAHLSCRQCGVESFMRGERNGAKIVGINVRCLDDVDPRQIKPLLIDGKSF